MSGPPPRIAALAAALPPVHDGRRWPRLKRRAAIALVLRERSGGIEVLVMRRREREGDRWSGDVACPGGFAHRDEPLLECAMRETVEELGLRLDAAALLGQLSVRPERPWHRFADFQVAPFVFAAPSGHGPLVLEESEVASARWVPLDAMVKGAPREHFWWWWRVKPLPVPVRVDRVWVDDYDVWGLTLRILEELAGYLPRG